MSISLLRMLKCLDICIVVLINEDFRSRRVPIRCLLRTIRHIWRVLLVLHLELVTTVKLVDFEEWSEVLRRECHQLYVRLHIEHGFGLPIEALVTMHLLDHVGSVPCLFY